MKKMLISMLAMAAMVSCSSESDPIDEVNPTGDNKVEIKLTTGVVDVTTKGINSEGTNFTNGETIQLLRWDGTESFTPTWETINSATATIGDNGKIILGDAQKYYNTNGENAYFMGIYPKLETGETIVSGIINYTNVGIEKDILSAKLTNAGSRASNTAAPKIEFKHLLSKVTVTLKGTEAAKQVFGNVISVTLKDVPQNLTLTLTGGTPSITAAAEAGKANIPLVTSGNIDLTDTNTPLIALIVPGFGVKGNADNSFKIKIETTNFQGNNALEVTVGNLTNGTESGKINDITLNFKDRIDVSTSISNWENGTGSNDDVDF